MVDNPTASINRPTANPTMKDLLDLMKKDILLNLNCHHLATIQSFNPEDQTVYATINYKKTYFQKNPQTGSLDPVLQDYPIAVDCPAIVLGGGSGHLTFPISEGDECLILFNDRAIDGWFQSGQTGALPSSRLHSFSDGIALVGLHSKQSALPGYDTSRALLSFGSTKVGVGEDKVLIANALTTLNTLLQDLITEIKNITTTNCVVGSPVAVSLASQTALANVATQIGQLLE